MNTTQTIETVRRYNVWRRGDDSIEQPEPKAIGDALDAICDIAEHLSRENARMRQVLLRISYPETGTPDEHADIGDFAGEIQEKWSFEELMKIL